MSCLILHKIIHEPPSHHHLFLEVGLTAPLLGLAGSVLYLAPLCIAPWTSPAQRMQSTGHRGKKRLRVQTIKLHQLAVSAQGDF